MYIKPIITSFIIFPFIAFIITLPYMIYQYRKFGSIPKVRVIIFYSFVLYLISAYFLVILPLPSMEYVKNLTTPKMQLEPFRFIKDIVNYTSFRWNDLNTYIELIKNPICYQVLYNVLLTFPFGVYLHYYYNCNFKKTFLYSFLLSLFFEITQVTGLYFIYPRSYRLFDVDDLIINTLGGSLGYLFAPLIELVLPTREEIDELSYIKGEHISNLRRITSFIIDLIIFIPVVILTSKLLKIRLFYSYIISYILYFIIFSLLLNSSTFGQKIVKIQVVNKSDEVSKIRFIIRQLLFGFIFLLLPYYFYLGMMHLNKSYHLPLEFLSIILLVFVTSMIIVGIITAFFREKSLFYEKYSKTKLKSKIKSRKKLETKE